MKVIIIAALVVCVLSSDPLKDSKHYDDDSGEHNNEYDHEAVLGSEDAAEEYSHLSPEEAKERLAVLVDSMDKDKNGLVTMEELVDWIKQSFMKLNVEETEERLQEDDKDGDGSVTWEEYLKTAYGMNEAELEEYKKTDLDDPEALKAFMQSMNYEKSKFNAADENKDKTLNKEEFAAFLHPYDYDRMADVESERVLADYDTDKNGKIELDEYLKNPVFSKKDPEDMVGEKENFNYHDADGDGALSRTEVLKWVSPNLDRIATEEANHLMSSTDKDKDGSLTKEEIVDEHELWVGSEATDYGELLSRDEL